MVTSDPVAAIDALGRAVPVVLVVAPGHPVGFLPREVALFVADPDDPTTWEGAAAMDAELHPVRL
ncbi:MAG: hypothetical protein M0Z30_21025 [Actinomycetota bacterium]|nr:hypothetical protein [Actinomycetota bacterium]